MVALRGQAPVLAHRWPQGEAQKKSRERLRFADSAQRSVRCQRTRREGHGDGGNYLARDG